MAGTVTNRSLWQAFADAGDGVARAFVEQPNFRIQLLLAAIAIAGAALFRFQTTQWVELALVIGMVLAAELFNTCLEHVVDLVEPQAHPLARAAKHAGAAAVLVASVSAIVVGALLFGPAIAAWLAPASSH